MMSHNTSIVLQETPTPVEFEQALGNPESVTGDHKTVFVESLNADIDEQIVDLVLQFNKQGISTVSSCQGNPGIIGDGPDGEGGMYGHVTFVLSDPFDAASMGKFVFGFLHNLTKDMYDNVRVEMTAGDNGFLGWVYFRNECVQELLGLLTD